MKNPESLDPELARMLETLDLEQAYLLQLILGSSPKQLEEIKNLLTTVISDNQKINTELLKARLESQE